MDKISQPLLVGRPNIGNREKFLQRVEQILDTRWFSNNGPFVKEFEDLACQYLGVKHCVSVCNATIGLEIASRALELTGEVILPSYTFIATAHAIFWQGLKPVFADIDPETHNICPKSVEQLITDETSGIIGVHLWGRPCDTERLAQIAANYNLRLMYDASHAFGCAHPNGKLLGNFGECEVFSFHATKFLNSFEGGIIATNNDELAEKMRLMRNFGFQGYDNVIYPGINGKMTEICAAMGITSFESIESIIGKNRENYQVYQQALSDTPSLRLLEYPEHGTWNYQYVVVEILSENAKEIRDQIIIALHDHNILARKYFWPGCHNMEPYKSLQIGSDENLPNTKIVADRCIVLPTGQQTCLGDISFICNKLLDHKLV